MTYEFLYVLISYIRYLSWSIPVCSCIFLSISVYSCLSIYLCLKFCNVLSTPVFLEYHSPLAPWQKKRSGTPTAPFEKREWHSLIALSQKECTLLALFFSKISVKKTCQINEDFFSSKMSVKVEIV